MKAYVKGRNNRAEETAARNINEGCALNNETLCLVKAVMITTSSGDINNKYLSSIFIIKRSAVALAVVTESRKLTHPSKYVNIYQFQLLVPEKHVPS